MALKLWRSLQLRIQQGRGRLQVVKRVMHRHVKDKTLGNSPMSATSTVVGRLSAVRLVSSRYTLWIGAYSPEHTASSTANKASTSTTANVSANTQANTGQETTQSTDSVMLPLTFLLPKSSTAQSNQWSSKRHPEIQNRCENSPYVPVIPTLTAQSGRESGIDPAPH